MHRARTAFIVASLVGGFLIALASPSGAPCHVGSFVGAPYRIDEGAGKVVITYSNGAGAQPGGTVDYKTEDGTAKAPTDYKSASGTLRWGAAGGTASVSGVSPAYRGFEVPIEQDSRDEPNETFKIVMSNFTGCFDAAISERSATVTIVDDDPAPKPKSSSPASTPKTNTPSGIPTVQPNAARTPSTAPTSTASSSQRQSASPLAAPRDTGDGGLSGGAIAGIVAGLVVLGGAALVVRRRFLS